MPDDDEQNDDKVWDEYDWERFLQQQDQKTEKYMGLLEKYIDDPNRDQIIAREMGWHHLIDKDGAQWVEEVDSNFEDNAEDGENGEAGEGDGGLDEEEPFEAHPLYQASFALTVWIDQLFEENRDLHNHPVALKLSGEAAVASAKLAAALSDDDVDEIGMTIAYLKRALRAITLSIEAAAHLRNDVRLDQDRHGTLNQRLFQIRDGIIELMGAYRSEFRRRYDRQ